jgi:multidrug efflux pump subunit AcrB
MIEVGGVTDVRDTLGYFKSQARFTALSEALNFYDLNEGDLLSQIRSSMTADKIGTFAQPGSLPDLDIVMGVSFPSRHGELGGPTAAHELESLSLVTERGERVSFVSLVDISFASVPLAIVHAEGDRAVTVKAHLDGDMTSAQFVEQMTPLMDAMSADWPLGSSYKFRGEVESSAQTYSSAGKAFMIALLLVFAILALLFSSFKQPIIIMAMAPLAMTGVFTGFYLLSIPMSFAAMIGIIALVGIIVNDSIVMVEVINHRLEEGMDTFQAAAHGASDRLRPILTTSITTIVGLTPLALSSPAWYPLCMAIILGLALATILALIVVPSLYVVLASRQKPQLADAAATV